MSVATKAEIQKLLQLLAFRFDVGLVLFVKGFRGRSDRLTARGRFRKDAENRFPDLSLDLVLDL